MYKSSESCPAVYWSNSRTHVHAERQEEIKVFKLPSPCHLQWIMGPVHLSSFLFSIKWHPWFQARVPVQGCVPDVVLCSAGMSENQEADLYSVLGATSCDTVQHIKHKYQQLVLQVNTDAWNMLNCTRMVEATTKTSVLVQTCDTCPMYVFVFSTTRTGSEATLP